MSVSLYGSGNTIIQVVNTTVQQNGTAYFSTSSSSLVSTGLSVTITPQSTTSKILLICNAVGESGSTAALASYTIYKNGSNLATGGSPAVMTAIRNGGSYTDSPMSITYLDAPATTSATTYTIYMSSSTGTCYLGNNPGSNNGNVLTFTALEISGS